MSAAETLITQHLDTWTLAIKAKSSAGRGAGKKQEFYGIKKLRELILELAVRGLLVPQDPNDEPASELLKKIAAERAKLVKAGKIKKGKKSHFSEDDLPFGIPKNWAWTQLGEISEIGPRNTLSDDLEVGFVPMPLIYSNYDGSHRHEIKTWREIKAGYTHFANGDIAIAKITPCFENSKAAIFANLENGYGAGTTELHVARLIGEFVNSRFILLYLKAPVFLEKGKPKMTGSAGQKRIPANYFSENPLPLPPLAEQHRIVAKVDELMTLCDQLEQQQEDSVRTHGTLVQTLLGALTTSSDHGYFDQVWKQIESNFDTLFTTESSIDQLKQTILQLAVMGKLVEQDPEDEPAVDSLAQSDERRRETAGSDHRADEENQPLLSGGDRWGIPETWSWRGLADLVLFVDYRGKTPAKLSSGIRLITAKNVRKGQINLSPNEFLSESEYHAWMTRGFPKVGDVLFTTEAPMGNAAVVELTERFALAQRVICFQIYGALDPAFLVLQILSEQFQSILDKNGTGVTAKGIKASKLKKLPIAIPPLAEQRRIVAKVDEIMALCDRLKASLQTAQATQVNLTNSLVEAAIS